jgi:hypothetical protein
VRSYLFSVQPDAEELPDGQLDIALGLHDPPPSLPLRLELRGELLALDSTVPQLTQRRRRNTAQSTCIDNDGA